MLYLQDLAKQEKQSRSLIITERLPNFILAPCVLNVVYQVEAKDDFYLIHLTVDGTLTILCQRCMREFLIPYHNQTTVAVCRNEERANRLFEHYECIVSSTDQVVLEDLIIDELHLYGPQTHSDLKDCDGETLQFLNVENKTY